MIKKIEKFYNPFNIIFVTGWKNKPQFKKNRFLISQIIVFLFFPYLTLYASNEEYLTCQGIYWSNKEAQYAEWKIIKRVSNYKIYFQINNEKKISQSFLQKR